VAEQSREPAAALAVADQHNVLLPGHYRASVGKCLLVVAPCSAGPGVVVLLHVGLHTSWTCRHHVPLHQTWHNVRSDAPLKAAAQPLVPTVASLSMALGAAAAAAAALHHCRRRWRRFLLSVVQSHSMVGLASCQLANGGRQKWLHQTNDAVIDCADAHGFVCVEVKNACLVGKRLSVCHSLLWGPPRSDPSSCCNTTVCQSGLQRPWPRIADTGNRSVARH